MRYIIGDVHGCLARLILLIESIEKRGDVSQIVFLGDYIDRGPHSKETIDYLIALSKKHPCVFLRGNHDDIFGYMLDLPMLSNPEYWVSRSSFTPGFAFDWFLSHGLENTLRSYDILDKLNFDKPFHNINLLKETVPEEHKEFFRNLVHYYECEDFVAYHAMPTSDIHESLWGRYMTLKEAANYNGKKAIIGHTPVQQYGEDDPQRAGNLILLDTLSFRDYGSLSAYCVETDSFISIS